MSQTSGESSWVQDWLFFPRESGSLNSFSWLAVFTEVGSSLTVDLHVLQKPQHRVAQFLAWAARWNVNIYNCGEASLSPNGISNMDSCCFVFVLENFLFSAQVRQEPWDNYFCNEVLAFSSCFVGSDVAAICYPPLTFAMLPLTYHLLCLEMNVF